MSNFLRHTLPLQKLRMFAEVVRQNSITKAAEQLCITQPAVSTAIKSLENYFDIKLIEVISKKIHLTAAAHVLYQNWLDVEVSMENLRLEMESFHSGVAGELRIVMVSSGKYFIPEVIHRFLQSYPNVRFSCDIKRRDFITEAMENDMYDIAILTDPPHSQHLSHYFLRDNPLVFIVHPEHHLAQNKLLTIKDLENIPFIMRESSALISQILMSLFEKKNIDLNVLFEMDSTEAIKQAVISGLGTALVPKFCVETEISYGILKILPVQKINLTNRWVLTCAKYTENLKLFQHFLNFLKN